MRLLLVTQAVDLQNPILGFFHAWIAEFSKHAERLVVIGQSARSWRLPPNVSVHSLWKERDSSRIRQVLRFWWFIWRERPAYDVVLVHMTPVWVVIGAPLWLLLRKRVYLWYEARGKRWPLRISLLLVEKVFSASAAGMPLPSRKSVITGHGIDTALFHAAPTDRDPTMLLAVGRITKSKRLELLLSCVADLPPHVHLFVIGGPLTAADEQYWETLQASLLTKGLRHRVHRDWLLPFELAGMYRRAALFLHCSETALDKALLEAMACGCLVASCSPAAAQVLPAPCIASPEDLPGVANHLLSLSAEEQERLRKELRAIVVRGHSLPKLVERLMKEMACSSGGTADATKEDRECKRVVPV